MDDERFDALVRGFEALGIRSSRRAGLRLLAAGALVPTLQRLTAPVAEAKKKHKHKKKRKPQERCIVGLETPCTGPGDCCGAPCCKVDLAVEGTCCTSDFPICYVFSEGTKYVCMEQ